jgi:hypothetical protein
MKPNCWSSCLHILGGLLVAALSLSLQGCGVHLACSRSAPGILFISSPNSGEVHFSCLLDAEQQSRDDPMESKKLTGVESITEPRGLAMDSVRMILYIVDGNNGAPQLYAARLYYSHTGNVAADAPQKLIEGLSSNWVAVDFRGTVFFTANNQLLAMSASKVTDKLDSKAVSVITAAAGIATGTTAAEVAAEATSLVDGDDSSDDSDSTSDSTFIQLGRRARARSRVRGSAGEDSTTSTEATTTAAATTAATTVTTTAPATDWDTIYDGQAVTGVSMPRGIAADGFHLYWTNGENGNADGTLVQGFEQPHGSTEVTPLDTSLPMAHGVCLSPSRIFFTDEESKVYSIKKTGGTLLTVTDQLQNPRGCAFDGDGTVFIADQGDSQVVSFAGGAAEMGPRKINRALSGISEPYGLAIYHKDHQLLSTGEEDDSSEAARGTSALLATVIMALINYIA